MESQILIHPDELSENWIKRAKENSIDVIGIHPVGGYRASESLSELVELMEDNNFTNLIDEAIEQGIKIEYEMHAASYLLPRDLFLSNPEYFRMDENGNRTNDKNMCVSNQKALTYVAKNAALLSSKLYKSTDRYYFWMDDVKNKRCMCDKCRHLTMSDQQMIYVNAMLKEIQMTNPKAKMVYLAYFDCIEPPKWIKPIKGVFFEYAPMEKYTLSNEEYLKLGIDESENLKNLFKTFSYADSKVLEYWLDNSMYSDRKKPEKKFVQDKRMIEEDIKRYLDYGFEYISSFACYLGPEYEKIHGQPDISAFINTLNKYK